MEVVILYFEGLLEESQGAAEFLGAAEHTCEVVVRHGSVAVALVGVRFRLFKKFKSNGVVLYI